MLASICVLFYDDYDDFDSIGRSLKSSKGNAAVIAATAYPRYADKDTKNKFDIEWNACYGKYIISSICNKIYEWKLRYTAISISCCQIGIISDHGFFL